MLMNMSVYAKFCLTNIMLDKKTLGQTEIFRFFLDKNIVEECQMKGIVEVVVNLLHLNM